MVVNPESNYQVSSRLLPMTSSGLKEGMAGWSQYEAYAWFQVCYHQGKRTSLGLGPKDRLETLYDGPRDEDIH